MDFQTSRQIIRLPARFKLPHNSAKEISFDQLNNFVEPCFFAEAQSSSLPPSPFRSDHFPQVD
jgi:hypothetical protein